MVDYPLYSNVPKTQFDQRADHAKRHGYASCVQWRSGSVSYEKPTNPYLQPYDSILAEAWEEGWMTAVATITGKLY
jgi:hypothetical protein